MAIINGEIKSMKISMKMKAGGGESGNISNGGSGWRRKK
jgi:hypothetical protein